MCPLESNHVDHKTQISVYKDPFLTELILEKGTGWRFGYHGMTM